MGSIKKVVKKAMTDLKIKKMVTQELPTLKKFVEKKEYVSLKDHLISVAKRQNIINDQAMFGNFVQEILNRSLDKSPEIKKMVRELSKEYNLAGLTF